MNYDSPESDSPKATLPNPYSRSQQEFAKSHGVDPMNVRIPNVSERLEQLKRVLSRKNVPFPIGDTTAQEYFALAESGKPFRMGVLSEELVDVQEYASEQIYEAITEEDHLAWACLNADQQSSKQDYACQEYLHGEELFEIGGNVIPDYFVLNARIYQQTGWQLVAVNEIIPAEVFFHCHSRKFFPVTTFMRPLGTDYLEEPDIGHDIAGHVATFTIPQVAEVMNNHGLANDLIHNEKDQKRKKARSEEEVQQIESEAKELLLYAGRLYWFTVEFGLVLQNEELKAFGAGILSSPGETKFSLDSPESNRVLIDPRNDRDLLRLATTDYLISEFQKTYFVMKDFDSLRSLTPERILRSVHLAQKLPHYTWREIVPGDEVINVGTSMTSINEKYVRLLSHQPLDECQDRAAFRNLRMYRNGLELRSIEETRFMDALPSVSSEMLEAFSVAEKRGEFARLTRLQISHPNENEN